MSDIRRPREYDDADKERTAHIFDQITGQAAQQGTLTQDRLLGLMRDFIVAKVPIDLDSYAHTILEL